MRHWPAAGRIPGGSRSGDLPAFLRLTSWRRHRWCRRAHRYQRHWKHNWTERVWKINYDSADMHRSGGASGLQSPADSVRLLQWSHPSGVPVSEHADNIQLIYIITAKDMVDNRYSGDHLSECYIIGYLNARKSQQLLESLPYGNFENIHILSSPDWSFHSNTEDVVKFIEEYASTNLRIVLFHAFHRTLKKFAAKISDNLQPVVECVGQYESVL